MNKLAGKVDKAEVYHLRSRSVPIEFRAGKLESIMVKEVEGEALRVIDDGRLGFATTTNVNEPAELIAAATAAAAFGEPAEFDFAAAETAQTGEIYDPAIVALNEEEMIAIGEQAIARLHTVDPEAVVNLSVEKTTDEVMITNTAGVELHEERTHISLSIEVEKARKGDIFTLYASEQARYLDDLPAEELIDRLAMQLHYGEQIVSVPSKELPVVFSAHGAVTILLPLMAGLNGKSVYMGISPLKDRIGEAVFDPRLTITDDGTLPRGPRTSGFDDEGTITARTPLVSGGVVAGFIYDRRTAALAGSSPTGNGYKGGLFGGGFRTPPGVGMGNLLIGPGETSLEQLIAGIDEGILVESVLGLGQGNINAGEFSNNVAVAFKIENGKIVGRVKNTMIAGNSYTLLKDRLIDFSNKAHWA
ncbi:TldD/PmbA family protein, partial [Candidatus Bipolaricaulota bacterium]|nr:TldD/PmbA family protein [Candidatus Bipolaricaulota bacterium]